MQHLHDYRSEHTHTHTHDYTSIDIISALCIQNFPRRIINFNVLSTISEWKSEWKSTISESVLQSIIWPLMNLIVKSYQLLRNKEKKISHNYQIKL